MIERRKGISRVLGASVVVVVLAVAGLAYYITGYTGSQTPTSTTSATTTSSHSSTSLGGNLIMILRPTIPLASSDVVANYTLSLHYLGTGSGEFSLTAKATPGITVILYPSRVVAGGGSASSQVSFVVSSGVALGEYSINISAAGSGGNFGANFRVDVVRYLVVTVGTTFVPANLNVQAGATVYWMRTNGDVNEYDNGTHRVVFANGMASSPALDQYQKWSYAFAAAGTYPYTCFFHPFMMGKIVVTP